MWKITTYAKPNLILVVMVVALHVLVSQWAALLDLLNQW